MKLISLNVEGEKHWALINPFMDAEKADVICLQEVFEAAAKQLAERLSLSYHFEPMVLRRNDDTDKESPYNLKGIALLSRSPLQNVRSLIYHDTVTSEMMIFDKSTPQRLRDTMRHLVIAADVTDAAGSVFTVGVTHFSWTPNGDASDYQLEDAHALLKQLAGIPEIILCGDFNAPRGHNEVYDLLAAKYEDAIPKSYITSLDPDLHRGYKNPDEIGRVSHFMVDFLFLSKKYAAYNVHLHSGVSDHFAVIGEISLRS